MKTLTRVAVYALVFSVAPFSISYAQEPMDLMSDMSSDALFESEQTFEPEPTVEDEIDIQEMQDDMENEDPDRPPTIGEARAALEALPGSKHAVKGKVPVSKDNKVYDIYGRQLAYREGAKEYTESLNKRREEFAKPRTERIKAYEETRDMIYAAETAEYQKTLQEEKEEMLPEKTNAPKLPTGEAYEAVVEFAPVAEEIGLKEQRIPTDPTERRKVVTAENAPAFDPAKLNRMPVAVDNVEPPPMPEVVKEVEAPTEKVEVPPVPVQEEVEVPMETVEVEPVVQPKTEEDDMDNPFAEKEERSYND